MDHLSLQHPVIIHCGFLCRPIHYSVLQNRLNTAKRALKGQQEKRKFVFTLGALYLTCSFAGQMNESLL